MNTLILPNVILVKFEAFTHFEIQRCICTFSWISIVPFKNKSFWTSIINIFFLYWKVLDSFISHLWEQDSLSNITCLITWVRRPNEKTLISLTLLFIVGVIDSPFLRDERLKNSNVSSINQMFHKFGTKCLIP